MPRRLAHHQASISGQWRKRDPGRGVQGSWTAINRSHLAGPQAIALSRSEGRGLSAPGRWKDLTTTSQDPEALKSSRSYIHTKTERILLSKNCSKV